MPCPLWKIVRLPVPCPSCHKEDLQTVDELIHNIRVRCGYCNSEIDISSEGWRASIQEIAQSLTEIRKYPPVGY